MRKIASLCVIVATFLVLVVFLGPAFSASKADESEPAKQSDSDGGIIGNIPPGSPFSKIEIGMSRKHVFDLIGPPTDTKHYPTGKSFIPFYAGRDSYRIEAIYKGQGRITFAGNGEKVYRIVYDPGEKGYAD